MSPTRIEWARNADGTKGRDLEPDIGLLQGESGL